MVDRDWEEPDSDPDDEEQDGTANTVSGRGKVTIIVQSST